MSKYANPVASNYALNVANVDEILAIFDSVKANTVEQVRSDELTAEQVAILNAGIVGNTFAALVPATADNIRTLLGLREAKSDELPDWTIGEKGYIFERNRKNRPKTLSRIMPATKLGTYSNQMVRGLWGSLAGVLLYTDEASIASAQHTLCGGLVKTHLDPENKSNLHFLIVVGLPPQFADWSDKGRSRNVVQDSFRDERLFEESVFVGVQPVRTAPKERTKERTGLLALSKKIAECCLNRFEGKDIPETGGKRTWGEESAFYARFAPRNWVASIEVPSKDNPETSEIQSIDKSDPAIESLALTLWEAGKSSSGKMERDWLTYFSPSVVASALVLASNDETRISALSQCEKLPDETVEEFVTRSQELRLSALAPDSSLVIDWELVSTVVGMLTNSTDKAGPLQAVFADLSERMKKDKQASDKSKYLYSPLSVGSMSACVQLIKNIRSGDLTSSVWTKYKETGKGDDKEVSPVYRCFGGVDVGYIQTTRKGKKSDE